MAWYILMMVFVVAVIDLVVTLKLYKMFKERAGKMVVPRKEVQNNVVPDVVGQSVPFQVSENDMKEAMRIAGNLSQEDLAKMANGSIDVSKIMQAYGEGGQNAG